jgi:cell volume regulation protein A
MLAGSEGLGGVEFDNAELARTLGTVGLVLILFEGGLTAGWGEIRPILRSAIALATVGTIITAVITGVVATWLFDLTWLEGMIIGAAVAATDSAAIFAVLRGSNLERKLARSLEGESGMNDPVALLLVVGLIDWIQIPAYGAADMALDFVVKLGIGAAVGLGLGYVVQRIARRIDLPTAGIYPVASIATAGVAYGLAEVVHGSGFLSVYLVALALGTGRIPGRATVLAFHQGVSWVAQIGLFFMLGLLVFPGELPEVALKGLALSAILILVARPVAAVLSTLSSRFIMRERLMIGWAGLRGATPIWLATFPVVANVASADLIFNIVFFVVLTSTLIQGATFEPIARRLRLTTDEPALPRGLFESGRIQRLGGSVVVHRLPDDAVAVGHMVKDLGLPREALVNVIVREGLAIPPRGSTELRGGDELHVLVREELREQVEELTRRWRDGPIGEPPPPTLPARGVPQIFTVRPATDFQGDANSPAVIIGIAVSWRLRSRRERPGALVQLVDGRFAVTGEKLVAVGGRRMLADWCERRARLAGDDAVERAWWQEVAGVLKAPGARR